MVPAEKNASVSTMVDLFGGGGNNNGKSETPQKSFNKKNAKSDGGFSENGEETGNMDTSAASLEDDRREQ